MKKIIAFFTACILSASAAGCGGSESAVGSADTEAPSSAEPVSLDGEITGEITVSCYDTMRYKSFLEEAAKVFEQKYPGTKVTIEAFSPMPEVKTMEQDGKRISMVAIGEEDEQTKADYINKINTELMSGGGADILTMDVLPSYKYAKNGQLENIGAYMEGDANFNKDDYRQNIFEALTDNGEMHIFPVDYSFTYFAYDSSLFTDSEQAAFQDTEQITFERLLELGKGPFERVNEGSSEPVKMFSGGAEYLFNQMLNANYGSFVDVKEKKADFTSGAFEELLETAKRYEENGYTGQMLGARREMSPDALETVRNEQFFFKPKNSTMLLQEFNRNSGMRMMAAGVGDSEYDKPLGLLKGENGETAFTCNQAYGINSSSDNKRTAWEFIKLLSSEEMQVSLNIMGLPVNYKAFLKKTELSITGALYNPENAGKELDAEGRSVFNSYVALADKYSGMLNDFFITDSVIDGAIKAETGYFFDGSKTSKEAASALQNRISLYLNE